MKRNGLYASLVLAGVAACATGGDPDRFFGTEPTEPADAGPPSRAPVDAGSSRRADDERMDASPDAGSTGSTVSCGGYAYPESVTVPSVACTGWAYACTGAHEFRVVGCHTSAPSGSVCPAGYKAAALNLIGQWAAAANIARLEKGRACVWANGLELTTACGGDAVHGAYCWTKGAACAATCGWQCCEGYPSSIDPCAYPAYEAPVLCVK